MISITNVLSYSPDYVVSILNERIGDIAESIGCYCADPVSDFTRSRKLPCDVLMKLIIQFQSKALNCELSDYFADFESLPTKSAFCQQRNKLEVEAFSRLFYTFRILFIITELIRVTIFWHVTAVISISLSIQRMKIPFV